MRHSLVILVLLTFFIFGCAENSSLVNPISESNDVEWISLQSNSLAKKSTDLIFTKTIDPAKGGSIKIKVKDDIKIKGKLKVRKNSFEGDPQEFVVDLSGEVATIDFSPSGLDFNPNAKFSIEYKGVELDDWTGIQFVYMADGGETVIVEGAKVYFNKKKGVLGVKNAKLSHFSRYGFVR